jgi:hypothetical protein
MGERGAAPDPLNAGLYCRHCASKYCSCDGNGNQETGFWEDEYSVDDDDWNDDDQTPKPEPDEAEPAAEDGSDGWSTGDYIAAGVGVAGAGVVVATMGVVGLPVVAAASGIGFAIGRWLSK